MAGFVDLLKLVVDADTKGAVSEFKKLEGAADSSLNGVEQKSKSFGSKLTGSFGSIGTAMASSLGPAAIAGTIGAGIGIAINAASNLNEQISKTKAVFGESSSAILKWSDSAATSLGQSKTQALEAASSFGNMFQQLGLTGDAVVSMSTKMTGLATDFASFFNTDPAAALEAISAAFRGEFDAVQKFVPTISAAAVQQEVLKEGLAKSTKEITEQDKAVATYNLLLHGAGQATGDFAKTSEGLANQQRILKAQVADAAAALGNQLLPAVAKLAGFASKAITIVVDIKQKTGGDKSPFFQDIGSFVSTMFKGITTGKPPWELWGPSADKTSKEVVTAFDAIKTKAADLGAAIGPAGNAIGDLARGSVPDLIRNTTTMGQSIATLEANFGTFEQRAAGIGHAMDEQASSIKKAEDALRNHTNAVLEATGSALGVSAAQREFNQSVIDADKVLKDSKSTTDDKSAALDRETQAALDTATATVNYAQKQEEAKGKTLSAQAANDILIGTLFTLASKANPEVQRALGDTITKLQETGQQHPKPTVTLNDQATAPLSTLDSKLNAINGKAISIGVNVNTESAASRINRIIDGLNIINQAPGGSNIRLGHIATGTNNWRGGLAMVGERGPELVMLPRGTQVKTAAETKAIMDGPTLSPLGSGGGNARPITIIVNGALVDQIGVGRAVKQAIAAAERAGVN